MAQQTFEGVGEKPINFKIVDSSGLVEHYEDGKLRLEVQQPSRVQPGMSAAAHDQEVSIHHHGDKSLAELRIKFERNIEDGKRLGWEADRVRLDELELRVLVALQHVRFRLRCRYGARDAYGTEDDRGTDVYDRWMRHAEPPSYALAFSIDRHRFENGKSHVVAWGTR